MIGEALYDLLSTNPAINAIVQGRVRAVKFPQGGAFPSMNYNTRSVQSIGCRQSRGSKTGILEIAILANDSVELESLADTVTDVLDNYEGVHKDFALSLAVNDDDFDEGVEDLEALYKRLQFEFTATKLQ